jgi:hypothetical protein
MKIPAEPTGKVIWERIFTNAEGNIAIQVIKDLLNSGQPLDTVQVIKKAVINKSLFPDSIRALKQYAKIPYEGREWEADDGEKSKKWQKVTTNEYKTSGGYIALYSQVSYETWRDDPNGRGLPDSCRGVLSYYRSDGIKLWEETFPKNIYSYGTLKLSEDGSSVFVSVSHVDSIYERGRTWVFDNIGTKRLDTKRELSAPVVSPNGRYYLSVQRIGNDPLINNYKVNCFDVYGGKKEDIEFKNIPLKNMIRVDYITNDGLFVISRTDINEIQIYDCDCRMIKSVSFPKVDKTPTSLNQNGKYISVAIDRKWRLFETNTMKELLILSDLDTFKHFPKGIMLRSIKEQRVLISGEVFFYGYTDGTIDNIITICGIFTKDGITKWHDIAGYYNAVYNEESKMVVLSSAKITAMNNTNEEREKAVKYNKQNKVVILQF